MKLLWINHFEYTVHPAFVSGQLVSMKLYLLCLYHLPKVSVCCCMFKLLHIIVHLNIQIPSTRAFFLRPRHALGRRRYRHVRGLAQLHGLTKSWHKIQQLYQLLVYTCFSGCRRDSRLPSAKKNKKMASNGSHVVFVCHSASVGERKSMTPHSWSNENGLCQGLQSIQYPGFLDLVRKNENYFKQIQNSLSL